MRKDIAIATITSDKCGNIDVIKQGLETLNKKFDVYVADRNSSEEFLEDIRNMGCKRIIGPNKTLPDQHKQVLLCASENKPYVLYTEPDKVDWFNNGLEKSIEEFFLRELDHGEVSRTPEQMKTFPVPQQMTEGVVNNLLGQITGIQGDYIYGPQISSSEILKTLKSLPKDISYLGWGTLTYIPIKAKEKGLRIGMIYNANECPISQRNEDNADYRVQQANGNIAGILLGLK